MVQEIAKFLRRTNDYRPGPDVRGVNAFLLRGVKAYCNQEGLGVCDDLNKMDLVDNLQYPNGFMPKGKANVFSHIKTTFLCFGLLMDGNGPDGVRDGACLALCLVVLCFSGRVFDITGFA